MNKSSKITRVASTVGILLGAFALSVFATNMWTPAPNAPSACDSSIPGCNTPLNVAAGAQSKVGGALYLNAPGTGVSSLTEGLRVWGTATFNNNTVTTGTATFNGPVKITSNAGANKILTSGADGTVSWQPNTQTTNNFGGIYMSKTPTGSGCRHINPITNACSCPSGYSSSWIWDWDVPNVGTVGFYTQQSGVVNLYLCTPN